MNESMNNDDQRQIVDKDEEKDLIIRLFVIGFHHKKGHQIEFEYSSNDETKEKEMFNDEDICVLMSSSLPDGVHQRDKDLIYFHLIPKENPSRPYFGLSSYRQIDAKEFVHLQSSEITRNSIQKSVTILLSKPIYGQLSDQFEELTSKYFLQKDFQRRDLFKEFVDQINRQSTNLIRTIENPCDKYSLRQFILKYRRKSLILFKLILLQKKVLFLLRPIETLVQTMLTLLSLFPKLLPSKQFEYSSMINNDLLDESNDEEVLFSLDDQQNDRSNEQRIISFSSSKDKSSENEFSSDQENLSIESISSQLPFPFDLLTKNHLFHPYLSIHSLNILSDQRIRSYLIGSSNQLFRLDEKSFDVIIDDQMEEFQIFSSQLKSELQLTRADLRFIQSWENPQTSSPPHLLHLLHQSKIFFPLFAEELLSEDELRHLFLEYFLRLLSVCQSSNVDQSSMSDYNLSFVRSFQLTDGFQQWIQKCPKQQIEKIFPKHPQSGQLNVNDVKLRVSQVFDESQAGRKMLDALNETSEFIGEKSRSAGKIIEQAKNSLFSSFIRTFQSKTSSSLSIDDENQMN